MTNSDYKPINKNPDNPFIVDNIHDLELIAAKKTGLSRCNYLYEKTGIDAIRLWQLRCNCPAQVFQIINGDMMSVLSI